MHKEHQCGCGHAHTESEVDRVVRLARESAMLYNELKKEEQELVDAELEKLAE